MKHYKKKTIALILASVVTVVGAFGAEHFSNSLMSLKFNSSAGGTVTMTVATKTQYDRPINLVKKDATTYVIMLPDTNSPNNEVQIDSGNIENVDVRTMPYTTNSNGYTKITVKTLPNTLLNTQKTIYVPESKPAEALPPPPAHTEQPIVQEIENPPVTNYQNEDTTPVQTKNKYKYHEETATKTDESTSHPQYNDNRTIEKVQPTQNNDDVSTSGSEKLLVILGILLVIISVVYLYIRGKNKMVEILGEQPDIDISEEKEAKKKEKERKQKVRNTINHIDRMYQKPIRMPVVGYNSNSEIITKTTEETIPQEEPQNIVDLDELFQEKNNNVENNISQETDEQNDELAAFLEEFNFEDDSEKAEAEVQEQELYNNELYEKYIHDGTLKFSQDDVEKINKLLNMEISDDTMKNLSDFVVTNPIENKKPSRTEILENFITSYTIDQNISFSKDDVDALYKLINVELDPDFITDLRTNPERVNEMRKEIQSHKEKAHKHSELLTLNVKDMLPDLSEALKKQGGKRIESEAKPEVVYFSEGYEVSTLSVNEELPDLAIEINNKNAYISRPSDEAEIVASGYEFDKLSVTDELPDLNDVLKNPDKYADEPEKPHVVDEDALLKNISNVTFKPFYDGSEEFEIINDFSDEEQQQEENTPSVSEVHEELNQFEDFEIIDDEENLETNETNFDLNIIKPDSLDDVTFYDLDKTSQISKKSVKSEIKDTNTEELLKLIEAQQQERKNRQQQKHANLLNSIKESNKAKNVTTFPKTINIDGIPYNMVNETKFSDDKGCYLAKDGNNYKVFGYIQDRFFELKQYTDLKTERFEARIREKSDDNNIQYIVRTGVHKFILNVSNDNMEFVMDLC